MERIDERVVGRVEVQDHDDVAVDAVHPLRAQAVGGVLHLQRAARRRADHQDVLRAGVLALDRGRGQVVQIDPVDLVVEVPGVAGRPSDQDGHHEAERAQDPGHGSPPRALLGGGVSAPLFALRGINLASQLVQALFDRVLGRIRLGGRAGRCYLAGIALCAGPGLCAGPALSSARPLRRHRPPRQHRAPRRALRVDLASESMEALLDGIVLGVLGAHGAVLCVTSDRVVPVDAPAPVTAPDRATGTAGKTTDRAPGMAVKPVRGETLVRPMVVPGSSLLR